MILAGDIGGTKTLIGLFEPRRDRPVPVDVRSFPTTEYPGLPAIIEVFLSQQGARWHLTAAAFGVAGPVINQFARMTNVEWTVDGEVIADALALSNLRILNDLEAMAYAVPLLAGNELRTLQPGSGEREGNLAVVAAGTGLGGALLHWRDRRYIPVASEIGHSDFPARTDRELEFVRFARARFGRVEIEHVLCGPGLLNLAAFTHDGQPAAASHFDRPADVARSALTGACPHCVEALNMFVDAYGAVAGNLALTAVTTGGVFIGGGIAPRILPALESGRLLEAFNAKDPMRPMLEAMPVHVILNEETGLLGAAVYANQQL
jgi:glucokinase